MQRLDGTLVLSATDLVGYLACDHLATLELGRVAGLWERPHRRDDPTIEIIQEKGDLHERAYLDALRGDGLRVIEIAKTDLRTIDDLRRATEETLEAMREGADVVYQATFFDGRWRGHADFLFRRDDRPSPAFGAWSYDIADTKLARAVKAGAVLQMCVYAALLDAVQGIPPEWLTVVTGDRAAHRHRTEDFSAFFRYVRTRFERRIERDADDPRHAGTYPDPVEHCRVCPWSPTCIQRRRDDDHLSIVAGMRRVDTERLMADGLPQLAILAEAASGTAVKEMPPTTFERLRNQARLQLHERRTGERVFELLKPRDDPDTRGLGILPEPSRWDVFFDIEADPWAGDDGLEYLLGIVTVDTGQPVYRPIWGTSPDGERAALGELLRLLMDRLQAHPELHVFHYGGYEGGALKRLVGRHGFGAEELDRLLRGDILVDLLNVVRQGIRASVESYSLKQIEKFYLPVREGPVTDAGFSVVEFERWLRQRDEAILDGIASYNRDDCVSTWMLRDWLEERRVEAMARWPDRDWTRPDPESGRPSEDLGEWIRKVVHLSNSLVAGLDPLDDGDGARSRRLLAGLLDWHRREEKSQWWRWFELTEDLSIEALVDERDALSGLEFVAEVGIEKKSVVVRYRFEPQDHPFGIGDKVYDTLDGKHAGEIANIDDIAGWVEVKRAIASGRPHPQALVKPPPISQQAMKDALVRVAEAVLRDGFGEGFEYGAISDLLAVRPPSIEPPLGAEVGADVDITAVARRLALRLDHAVLPIQGPPGTGKTYTAARMITTLARAGRRVAITAQSHRTISNLVEEVLRAADLEPEPVSLRIVQRAGEADPWVRDPRVTRANDPATALAELDAGANVIAGTSWQLARADMDQKLDVLFVDEAGQYSIANVVAAGTCAKSIVLVGDPNQLPMVTQGVHPDGVNVSGLAHLLAGEATISPQRGLFLDQTRRLHPRVNTFVSDAFYEGRLEAHPSTRRVVLARERPQPVKPHDPLAGAGVRWLPVIHRGNSAHSAQEAAVVADAVAELVGRRQRLADGTERAIELDEVIVVTPYNAQVAEIQKALKARLGTTGNVGTVDKFQGREGVVAIYSMASSSRDDAPRDMSFLYSRNRLNVAVSRAESIAVVVASPEVLEAGCRTPEQMRLLDALCRFVEVAGAQVAEGSAPEPAAVRAARAGPAGTALSGAVPGVAGDG